MFNLWKGGRNNFIKLHLEYLATEFLKYHLYGRLYTKVQKLVSPLWFN